MPNAKLFTRLIDIGEDVLARAKILYYYLEKKVGLTAFKEETERRKNGIRGS